MKKRQKEIEWLREQLEASQNRVMAKSHEIENLRRKLADRDDQISQIRKIIGPSPTSIQIGGGGGAGGSVLINGGN